MQKLLIATKNHAKFNNIKKALSELPVHLVSLTDMGISDDFEETGVTYQENSTNKALFYTKKSLLPTIADDSGLEIAALDGAPGIKSRRWLGYHATDEELIEYMKKVALELPDDNRNAQYRAVVTFALPSLETVQVEGTIQGLISQHPHPLLENIAKGFPYDYFFYLPELKKHYLKDRLTENEDKEYNHRRRAIRKMIPIIKEKLNL